MSNPLDNPTPAPRRRSRTARAAKVAMAAMALLLLPLAPRSSAKDAPPPATQRTSAEPPAAAGQPTTTPGENKENKENKEGKAERHRPERKPERPIWGTISKVEDGALYLLIGDAKREVIVPVQPETEVFIAGRKASFADLGPEWSVNIIQEQGLTRTINAKPPRPKPPVKKPDGGNPAAAENAAEKQP